MTGLHARQIPVSRAFKAAPRKCKQVSIPLDLHLNSHLSNNYNPRHSCRGFVVYKAAFGFSKLKPNPSFHEVPGELLYIFTDTDNFANVDRDWDATVLRHSQSSTQARESIGSLIRKK